MTTRRNFLAGAAVATSALASAKWNRANAAEEVPKMGEFLFVQTSKGPSAPRITVPHMLLRSHCRQ